MKNVLSLKKNQIVRLKLNILVGDTIFKANELMFVNKGGEKPELTRIVYLGGGRVAFEGFKGKFYGTELDVLNKKTCAESPFDKLAIKDYKEGYGMEHPSFVATLTLEGEKVAVLKNDGNGGGTFFDYYSQDARKKLEQITSKLLELVNKLKSENKIKDKHGLLDHVGLEDIETYFIEKHYLVKTVEEFLIGTEMK